MDLLAEIGAAAGREVTDIEPLGGGCVSSVYRVTFPDGPPLVAKVDESGAANLPVEARMLRYLSGNTALPVPDVAFSSDRLLLMTCVPGQSDITADVERHAAELLAALHDLTSPTYGFEWDTLIGGLRQPNPPTASWIEFFAQHRLLFMAAEVARAGRMPAAVVARLDNLCARLDEFLPEPERPSLVHGDVWTTNILARNGRVTAFIDPAIYFAHNEIELAFTTLFGTFGRAFFDRYHEIRPIAPGFFQERRDLYNLYPLLVHARLFGGSYVSSVTGVLERLGF